MRNAWMLLPIVLGLCACGDSRRLVLVSIPKWPTGIERCEIEPQFGGYTGHKITLASTKSGFAFELPPETPPAASLILAARGIVAEETFATGAIRYEVNAHTTFPLHLQLAFDRFLEGVKPVPIPANLPANCPNWLKFESEGWYRCYVSDANFLYGVWGSQKDDVWVVGSQGTILHMTGGAWTKVPSGTASNLRNIWGSGPNDIWAIGDEGTTLHWNGSAWTQTPSGSNAFLFGIWGSGPDDVWVLGDGRGRLRFNGSAWALDTVPPYAAMSAIWGSGPRDVWIAGGDANRQTVAFHFNGDVWRFISTPPGNEFISAMWGSAANSVWAATATGKFIHWDGSVWGDPRISTLRGVDRAWGTGPNDIWFSGGAQGLAHFDGNTSTTVNLSDAAAYAIWGSAPDDLWVVGAWLTHGAIFHYSPF